MANEERYCLRELEEEEEEDVPQENEDFALEVAKVVGELTKEMKRGLGVKPNEVAGYLRDTDPQYMDRKIPRDLYPAVKDVLDDGVIRGIYSRGLRYNAYRLTTEPPVDINQVQTLKPYPTWPLNAASKSGEQSRRARRRIVHHLWRQDPWVKARRAVADRMRKERVSFISRAIAVVRHGGLQNADEQMYKERFTRELRKQGVNPKQ